MQRMMSKGYLAILLSVLISATAVMAQFGPGTARGADAQGDPSPGPLPAGLVNLLGQRFRQYQLPGFLMPATSTLRTGAAELPYVVTARLDDDDLEDVALLLFQGGPPYRAYDWLVYVFYQDRRGGFGMEGAYRLDEFQHRLDSPRPIDQFRLRVHPADQPIVSGDLTLGHSYRRDAVALVRLSERGETIERIYGWDPGRQVIRRTILDALGREAVRRPAASGGLRVTGRGKDAVAEIPGPLEELLRARFPEFRLPNGADLRKGRWVASGKPGTVPWATSGDFNGDGAVDLAVFLLDPGGGTRFWRAMIFMQTDNHGYESYELKRFSEWVAPPRHARAGQKLPAPPPQDYGWTIAPAGSPRFGRPSERFRFDTPLLIWLPEQPLDRLRGARIGEWLPHSKSISGGGYGEMTD